MSDLDMDEPYDWFFDPKDYDTTVLRGQHLNLDQKRYDEMDLSDLEELFAQLRQRGNGPYSRKMQRVKIALSIFEERMERIKKMLQAREEIDVDDYRFARETGVLEECRIFEVPVDEGHEFPAEVDSVRQKIAKRVFKEKRAHHFERLDRSA